MNSKRFLNKAQRHATQQTDNSTPNREIDRPGAAGEIHTPQGIDATSEAGSTQDIDSQRQQPIDNAGAADPSADAAIKIKEGQDAASINASGPIPRMTQAIQDGQEEPARRTRARNGQPECRQEEPIGIEDEILGCGGK